MSFESVRGISMETKDNHKIHCPTLKKFTPTMYISNYAFFYAMAANVFLTGKSG